MGLPLFAPRRLGRDSSAPPRVVGPDQRTFARGREVAALLLWSGAVFVALALASYQLEWAEGAAQGALNAAPAVEGAEGVAEAARVDNVFDDGPALRAWWDEGALVSTGPSWMGAIGELVAGGLAKLLGVCAWVFPLELFLLGVPFVSQRKSLLTVQRLAGNFLVLLLGTALVQVAAPEATAFGVLQAGGVTGELFGELMRSLFSTAGSFLVALSLIGLVLIGRASFSFIALVRWVARLGTQSAEGTRRGAHKLAKAWKEARDLERSAREEERPRIAAPGAEEEPRESPAPRRAAPAPAPEPIDEEPWSVDARSSTVGEVVPSDRQSSTLVTPSFDIEPLSSPEPELEAAPSVAPPPPVAAPAPSKRARKKSEPAAEPDQLLGFATTPTDFQVEPIAGGSAGKAGAKKKRLIDAPPLEPTPTPASAVFESSPAPNSVRPIAVVLPAEEDEPVQPVAKEPRSRKVAKVVAPQIVDTSAALQPEKAPAPAPKPKSTFALPSIDFLVSAPAEIKNTLDEEKLFANAELLIKTLGDYGVTGKVEEILPGPTVTTYEVSPAPGTKVSKVAGLADDLALALARKVRIVAPIPGKNRIGFELPNEHRKAVNLRDLVEDSRFSQFEVPLPVVLGRDIVGKPVYADLASMPHVIVAGATGAGKSVGLNVMLTSLLYRRSPEELRMLMIDPKVVELAPFDRIPHMLLPVVTDMKQAANALKWAVDEMERRYQLFADAGTKNITTYNAWAQRVEQGVIKNPNAKKVKVIDHNGLVDEVDPAKTVGLATPDDPTRCGVPDPNQGEAPLPEKMPFIVIVVDEFADLMMQQGKEVEAAVARLAQKARAAGMHVILATQRPSVDVITGMIKANFPTRIAFRVAQKVDSRTILDEQGAEHLLGRGDMLIRLNGTNETRRVQCPWVSEEEVQLVTDHLRAQGEPVYDENILKPRDEEGAPAEEDAEQDPLYDDAVRIVADNHRCSTSWLQRKLTIGYNRAARMVEMMERRGLVGPANGSKDREVLIDAL